MVEFCQRKWFTGIIDKCSDTIFLCLACFFIMMAMATRATFWMIMMMVLMFMLMLVMVVMFVFMLVMVFMAVMGLVMGCLVDVVMNGVLDGAQSHIVAVLLLAVDRHLHVGAGDAAGDGLPGRHRDAGEQAVHGVPKDVLLGLGQQLVQGGHQHVAGGAHIAFQIQCFHSSPSIWLMRLARKPAPKPLSMFTTLTPLAQEFSMDKRALMPPKEAP